MSFLIIVNKPRFCKWSSLPLHGFPLVKTGFERAKRVFPMPKTIGQPGNHCERYTIFQSVFTNLWRILIIRYFDSLYAAKCRYSPGAEAKSRAGIDPDR